jgi:CHAD domain-containing protein
MGTQHVEIERKFDVGAQFAVPDLGSVPGVASESEPEELELSATYHDTPGLRLLRSRVTLRRRTGGNDAGWHVKLPAAAGARTELHQPLGRAVKRPPADVLAPVRGLVGTQDVGPVATVHTHRVLRRLYDADGRQLAEVADDLVTGTALPAAAGESAAITSWREIEVELVDGGPEVLAAVADVLVAAGARPSGSPSKVGQVLRDRLAAIGGPAVGAAPEAAGRGEKRAASRRPTAGDVVRAAVAAQAGDLRTADLAIRAGQGEGVHDFRVACRRLRSTLAVFRSVLERESTDPVRAELQWAGRELSAARDGEVALEHLRELVAEQPVELVLGPVAARLQQAQLRDRLAGEQHALEVLAGTRYLRLVDALDLLLLEPPVTPAAAGPARPVLRAAVRRSRKRVLRQARVADRASGAQRHTALHEVRKAAKRARYTAEVVEPVLGRRAKALRREMKRVQTTLGYAGHRGHPGALPAARPRRRAGRGESLDLWAVARSRGGARGAGGGTVPGPVAAHPQGAEGRRLTTRPGPVTPRAERALRAQRTPS